MSSKRSYPPWLAPLYKRFSLARFLLWQSRFLTEEGLRNLILQLAQESIEQMTFTRQGIRWTVYAQDKSVGSGLFFNDESERCTINMVLAWMRAHQRIPQFGTILEIGANIGTSTIPFLLDTPGRVFSVEPVPRNRNLLELNLKQNRLDDRVTILPYAIADENGTKEMVVPLHRLGGAELATSQLFDLEKQLLSPYERITVQTIRLDELLDTQQIAPSQVAFVWSDTQGSEGAVIRTGEPLWKAEVPLWVEVEPHLIQRQDTLEHFFASTARHFAFYIPASNLQTQGVDALPQPIATLQEFAKPFFGTHTDVLLLPRATQ
jgi:FkbM family methyltransferase